MKELRAANHLQFPGNGAYEESHGVKFIHKASVQITDGRLGQFQIKSGNQQAGVLHVGGIQNRSPYPFRLLE